MKSSLKKMMLVLTFVFALIVFIGCGEEFNLTFAKTSYELEVGEEVELNPTITGTSEIEYSFDKEGIIEINANKAKAIAAGEVTVTASLKEDNSKKVTITFKVTAQEEHEHTYEEVVDEKYLASAATCQAKAKYYKSCNCGEKSEETFEAGELGEHVFDQEIVDDKYLASAATSESKAKYYKSCVCGEKGEETFEAGELLSKPTSIQILNKFENASFGDEIELEVEILPAGSAQTSDVEWELSSSDIEMDGNTLVVFGTGEFTVTAKLGELSDSFTFTVNQKITDLTIKCDETTLNIGDEIVFKVEVQPENAPNNYSVSFNPSDAVKEENGKYYAEKSGLVTITVDSQDGSEVSKSMTIKIRDLVSQIKVEGASTMFVGKEQGLSYSLIPSTNVLTDVTFASSNEEVATVNEQGVVKALAIGKTVITVTSVDAGECSETFEIEVKAAPLATDTVYLNGQLSTAKDGDKVTYNGVEYIVGTTAFATLDTAIEVATKEIYVENYEITSDYTLAKNGISFIGDGKTFKVLKKFTIGETISNVKLEGIIFDVNSQVWGVGSNENITINNCNFDGNKSDSSKATVYFAGAVKNLVVTNSSFIDAVCARSIRTAKALENLTIDNCKFGGSGSFDPIRTDSTLSGNITITNCLFDGTEQSGIMIRTHSSGTYVFNNNVFNNIKGSAIWIKGNTGSACTSTFEIKYNVFDNSEIYTEAWDKNDNWGCIGFEANDYTLETLSFNANYNQFIGWGTYILCDNLGYKLKCTNFDYNYFSTSVEDSYFDNIATYENIFESIDALKEVLKYKDINESDENTLVVGDSDKVLKTKYATINEALNAAKKGSTIYILPGTYNEDLEIKLDNLTIKTLNSEINPTSEEKNAEVIFTGKITIGSKTANLSIAGIKFEGSAKIVNQKGQAGTADNTDTNLNGFEFKNNYVSINHTSGNGFIEFAEAASSYSHNVNISNNYFTTESTNASKAVVWLDNVYDLVFEENVFENVTGTAFYITDTTKALSGQYDVINSNKFKNISGSAIHINWMSPLPKDSKTGNVEIQNNEFDTIGENAIYVGEPNNTDGYQSVKIMFNKFKAVKNGIYLQRVQAAFNMSAKYNTFYDEPTGYYFFNNSKNSKTTTPAAIDATTCIYYNNGEIVEPNSAKFSELVTYAPAAKSLEELPSFDGTASAIEIKDTKLYVGDTKQLEIEYTPSNITNTGVTWNVDDSSVATIDANGNITALKEGKVKITAIYNKNNKVMTEKEFIVTAYKSIEVRYEGSSIIKAGATLQLSTKYINCEGNIVYTSLTPEIASVDANGLVTAIKDGQALISVKVENTNIEAKVGITVADITTYSALMQRLAEANNENVMYRNINYIGYEKNYTSVAHKVYGSVNAYFAGELPEVQKNMLSTSAKNWDGREQKSIEFIVVHDTGAAAPTSTAKANSNWCTNATNTGSSWHYTIGNDGLYQQIEEGIYAWHAGDNTDWAETTVLTDTGVAFDGYRPEVTISEDGYFVINGTKTTVESPRKEDGTVETRTNELGILVVKGDNGNYWIPTTWISSGYNNVVCIRGGNINGIGIESAVNTGSDVYLTWQYLAKFVAQLLVKYDLLPDRVAFHNNFANKTCPNTMMTNGLVDMFLEMVYAEYDIAKEYSDYKVEFISNNPEIIDNTGRIVNQPETTTNVSYTVKITKGETVEELVLNAIVPGTKTLQQETK